MRHISIQRALYVRGPPWPTGSLTGTNPTVVRTARTVTYRNSRFRQGRARSGGGTGAYLARTTTRTCLILIAASIAVFGTDTGTVSR